MFGEVYMQPFPYVRQSSIGGIEKHVGSHVILWPYPLSFEDAPECFRDVQLRRIRRQEEEEKTSPLPYWTEFPYLLVPMDGSVVKYDKGIHFQAEGDFIEETYDLVCRHPVECGESLVTVVTVYHPKDVEACDPLGRDIHVLTPQLPAVRDVSFRTCVALIGIIEPYASIRRLSLKFLQLPDLVFIELRRGYSPWAFPYTLISCANADKKRLNIELLTSFPEAFSHAALALPTLCLSCSIARRTASSSEQSMIGFLPRPGRVFNPSMPSDLNRFIQAFTLTWLISVCAPAATEDRPSAFSSTARQRIRKQCFPPKRNPLSSERRSASVSSNTFDFPIMYKTEKTRFISCKLILRIYLSYKDSKGKERYRILYNGGFKRKVAQNNAAYDYVPQRIAIPYPSLAERLLEGRCEICGSEGQMLMHHVRNLNQLKGELKSEALMLKRHRKTLVVCEHCNSLIQKGVL